MTSSSADLSTEIEMIDPEVKYHFDNINDSFKLPDDWNSEESNFNFIKMLAQPHKHNQSENIKLFITRSKELLSQKNKEFTQHEVRLLMLMLKVILMIQPPLFMDYKFYKTVHALNEKLSQYDRAFAKLLNSATDPKHYFYPSDHYCRQILADDLVFAKVLEGMDYPILQDFLHGLEEIPLRLIESNLNDIVRFVHDYNKTKTYLTSTNVMAKHWLMMHEDRYQTYLGSFCKLYLIGIPVTFIINMIDAFQSNIDTYANKIVGLLERLEMHEKLQPKLKDQLTDIANKLLHLYSKVSATLSLTELLNNHIDYLIENSNSKHFSEIVNAVFDDPFAARNIIKKLEASEAKGDEKSNVVTHSVFKPVKPGLRVTFKLPEFKRA